MDPRKLLVAVLSVAVVAAGGLVAWSAGGHPVRLGAGVSHPGAARPAVAAASPTATPKPTKRPAATRAPAATLDPAHRTTASTTSGCGSTVTKSIRLTVNLANCPGDGLIVGANNITIDLADFSITGTNGKNSAGIRNDKGYKNVTIRGGSIAGFHAGIAIGGKGAVRNTVENMTISHDGEGVALGGGSNTVSHNTVGDVGGYAILAASDSNSIVENDISNARPGISIAGKHNTLNQNTITGGGDAIAGVGDDNVISENDVRDGAGAGIVLLGSNNVIGSNTVKNFRSVGIWTQQVSGTATPAPTNASGTAVQSPASSATHDNTVKDNDVSRNGNDGILVDSDNSTLDSNDSSNNASDGITTRGTNPLITDNDANANGGHGIDAAGGVRGSGNSASGNGQSDCSPAALCD
jgi:parallel beta-helix repeat protein